MTDEARAPVNEAADLLDEIDRALGVGRWYREDEWCPDCHMRYVNHGPHGEHG